MAEIRDFLEGRLTVKTGDITEERADAIVNAANSSLMGGGGVDGAIHRKGGPAILKACRAVRNDSYPEGLPTGKAVVTEAGNLPCRFVIHTVGPVWNGGGSGEPALLESAYRESLLKAEEIKAERIVFPAISTGIYGYPKDLAARTAYRTVEAFLESHDYPKKVVLLFFAEIDADAFVRAIKA